VQPTWVSPEYKSDVFYIVVIFLELDETLPNLNAGAFIDDLLIDSLQGSLNLIKILRLD
jgi:hypothetical protein